MRFLAAATAIALVGIGTIAACGGEPSEGSHGLLAYSTSAGIRLIDDAGEDKGWLVRTSTAAPAPEFAWSPDGGSLAYSTAGEVKVVNAEGRNPRRVAGKWTQRFAHRLAWSPGRTQIAFLLSTDAPRSPFANASDDVLHVVRVDGSTERVLGGAEWFSWSPDGKALLALRGTSRFDQKLLVLEPRGGAPRHLANGSYAAWSPRGRRVAFVTHHVRPEDDDIDVRSTLSVIGADGASVRVLGQSGLGLNSGDQLEFGEPTWELDGTSVLVPSSHGLGSAQVERFPANGGKATIIADISSDQYNGVSFSPDRKRIAVGGFGGLVVIEEGAEPVLLAPGAAPGWIPNAVAWSHDGKKVAYTREGRLRVVDADGTNEHFLSGREGGVVAFAWRPAGAAAP